MIIGENISCIKGILQWTTARSLMLMGENYIKISSGLPDSQLVSFCFKCASHVLFLVQLYYFYFLLQEEFIP